MFIPIFQLLKELIMVPTVEAPFTFLQEAVEVLILDSIEASKGALVFVPEILNAVIVFMRVGKVL